MTLPAINAVLRWRALFVLALIPALVNCSRIDGAVELHNNNGEPYSFEGAEVEVFDLDPAVVLAGQKMPKGLGSVENADGAIVLQVITATIEDGALYDVEIRCPANNATGACNVESPLHLVLSGAQLKAGGWTATALSEVIFHNIAYYVATDHSADDIQQMLDIHAGALLVAEPAAPARTYADVLTWSPDSTNTAKHPGLLGDISELLAQGSSITELKLLARQWTDPFVASLTPEAMGLSPTGITLVDGYAYLSGRGSSFGVLDVRDPAQPIVVAEAENIDAAGPVFILGNTAFVQDFGSSTQAVDISNPQQPALIGNVAITGRLRDVAADHAYATTASGLQIFNVANPLQPALIGQIALPNVGNIAFSGDRLYLIAGNALHIFNISNLAAPIAEGSLPIPNANATSPSGDRISQIEVSDGYAYITTFDPQRSPYLAVVDVSTATTPTLVTQLALPTSRTHAYMEISQEKIFLSSNDSLLILDAANPAAPVVTQKLRYSGEEYFTRNLAFSNGLVYVIDPEEGLAIFDPGTTTPSAVLSGSLVDARVGDAPFASVGNYAYVSRTGWGFDVINLTDPVAPVLSPGLNVHIATSIAAGNGHLFRGGDNSFGSIAVADISNPLQPVDLPGSIIRLDEGGSFYGFEDFAVVGNALFATWGDRIDDDSGNGPQAGCSYTDAGAGIFKIDISVPQAAVVTDHLCMWFPIGELAADEAHAYVTSTATDPVGSYLSVINHSGAGLEDGRGTMLGADPNFMAVNGSHLWATQNESGFEIVDVGNPDAPAVVASINTPGQAQYVTFDERYAYVADGHAGVSIFDITTPAAPVLTATASTRGNAYYVFLSGGYLYSGTSYGLEVLRPLP